MVVGIVRRLFVPFPRHCSDVSNYVWRSHNANSCPHVHLHTHHPTATPANPYYSSTRRVFCRAAVAVPYRAQKNVPNHSELLKNINKHHKNVVIPQKNYLLEIPTHDRDSNISRAPSLSSVGISYRPLSLAHVRDYSHYVYLSLTHADSVPASAVYAPLHI